jgi:SAM-dependent methyltransferase
VLALEVDTALHATNTARAPVPRLAFMLGGADEIPLQEASCDVVLMLKSLHHVPTQRMDRAFAEIRRVLVPGGHAYISEPVYAGPFNDIVRTFHDEGAVRAAAYDAVRRATAAGVMQWVDEIAFDMPVTYVDFDDFDRRLVRSTPGGRVLTRERRDEVRRAFEAHLAPDGARVLRPMRVNLLRAPVVDHARPGT